MAMNATLRARGAAALLALTLLASVLGAAPGVAAGGAEPVLRDAVTVPIIANPASINPILASDSYGRAIVAMLYPSLATLSPGGAPQPLLAKSWSVVDKGFAIDVLLRSGLKWSDGQSVTARDVATTFNAMADRRDHSPYFGLFGPVMSVAATSPTSLRIDLSRPDTSLLRSVLLAPIAPSSVLAPLVGHGRALASNADLNRTARITAGPFRLVAWDQDTGTFRFARNLAYPFGRARLAALTLQYEPTADAAWQAFVAGQVAMANVPADAVSQANALAKAGKLRLLHVPAGAYTYIPFNMYDPIWRDPSVRIAAVEAVDRGAIARQLPVSPGAPTGGPPPMSLVASNGNMAGLAYNLAHARALLEADGWRLGQGGVRYKDGKPLAFTLVTVAGVPLWDRCIGIVVYDLRLAGFAVTVQYQTFASLAQSLTRPPSDDSPGAWALAWTMSAASDARTLFGGRAALPPGGQDVGGYADAVVTTAMGTLAVGGSPAARRHAESALRTALRSDPPAIFLYRQTGLVATVPSLHIPVPTASLGQSLVDPQAWYVQRP